VRSAHRNEDNDLALKKVPPEEKSKDKSTLPDPKLNIAAQQSLPR
jgi:hypothetical protein